MMPHEWIIGKFWFMDNEYLCLKCGQLATRNKLHNVPDCSAQQIINKSHDWEILHKYKIYGDAYWECKKCGSVWLINKSVACADISCEERIMRKALE